MSLDCKPTRRRVSPPRIQQTIVLVAALIGASLLAPEAASAHGISGLASLSVPAWLFAWAAAIVVVASFVLLSAMWSRPRLQDARGRRVCTWPAALSIPAGVVGLSLFGLVIYAGYEGVSYCTSNLRPDVHLRDLLGCGAGLKRVARRLVSRVQPVASARSPTASGCCWRSRSWRRSTG